MGIIYFKYTVCEVFVCRVRDRGAYIEFVIITNIEVLHPRSGSSI